MNHYILKNLRKRFSEVKQELLEEEEAIEEVASLIPFNKSAVYNININKFDKPVGAVVLTGGEQNIKDIIDIKKEDK